MRNAVLRLAIGAAALMLGMGLLAACSRPAPESALRERIAGLQAHIEQRDASGVAGVLAEDFIGPDGLDRDGARRLSQATFLRYRNVGLEIGPLDVDLKGDDATVRFTAMLRGGEGVLLQDARVYDVRTGWRRDGDDWELVNASWQPRL